MKISFIAKNFFRGQHWKCWLCFAWTFALLIPAFSRAQEIQLSAASQFAGRTVEEVRIEGNRQVSTAVIRELIRTHEGDKFDPATVVADYQRIYDKMKLFANVEARVQPTAAGVIVVFVLTEENQIKEIAFDGNVNIKSDDLLQTVELKKGQAIDNFRISLAQQAIERLYRQKNFPFAHVKVTMDDVVQTGLLDFKIVEGPETRITKIDFIGNNSFSSWRLKDQIQTAYYVFIFRPGTFDPEQVEEDVASLLKYYQNKGFWDAKIGRKLTRSTDMKSMEVTFLIDEGPRYMVDHVYFKGNNAVTEGALRKEMHMVEGVPFDQEGEDGDRKSIVRTYSKVGGYIFEEQPGILPNPDYLQIDVRPRFKDEPGHMDLVYTITEGRVFRINRILIKGNGATKDNVILRELRMRPGQQYDSGEVEDAADRLRGLPNFKTVNITPIESGDTEGRDLLVEVEEQRTAQISAGVGVNSNGGVGGNFTYDQKNFDIANPPSNVSEFFSNRAFAGAGQDFRADFSPGTIQTDADVSFTEPYILDQPFAFTIDGFLNDRIRENYNDDRVGGSIIFGHQFNYVYSTQFSLTAQDVDIKHVTDPVLRAPEINDGLGHHTLTSTALSFIRDTTNHGPVIYKGNFQVIKFEQFDTLGGTVNYNRLSYSFDDYQTVGEDLVNRRTVWLNRLDVAGDPEKAPFYERFYGGGIGSIRGFSYRGISPRSGPFDDPVGGDFSVAGGSELDFPLVEDFLRGDAFFDADDVETQAHFGTMRMSVGLGVRIQLAFFGQKPLALDFGVPITQNRQDRTQVLSFSFGISR